MQINLFFFAMLVRHIGSVILNFCIFILYTKSASQKLRVLNLL